MHLLLVLSCSVLLSAIHISDIQALECGLHDGPDHETVRKMAATCLKSSKNKGGGGGGSGGRSTPRQPSADDDGEEEEENEDSSRESERVTSTTASSRRPLRTRTRSRRNIHNTRGNSNSNNKFNQQQYNPNNYPSNNQDSNQTERCTVITCILTQLRMTDRRGFPDKALVTQVLTKNVRSTELKDFLQESTDDCFELLGGEPKKDTCEYSTHLINCLAEKGKNSCDDWQDDNMKF